MIDLAEARGSVRIPSEPSVLEPEWDRDYIPECPSDFDDEQDVAATEEFLNSLVFTSLEWRTLGW